LDFPSAEAAVAYAKMTGPQFYRAGSCSGDAGLLPDDAWILGFVSDHVAAPNAWVSGIVIGAVATAALTKLAEWGHGSISYSGYGWVPASPWVLSSRIRQQRDGPTVGIELIVAVLAGLSLWFMHQTPQRVSAQR
jgi:hypothetical protein